MLSFRTTGYHYAMKSSEEPFCHLELPPVDAEEMILPLGKVFGQPVGGF